MRILTTNFLYCFDFFYPFEHTSFSKSSIEHFIKKEQCSRIAKMSQNAENYVST